MRQKRKHVALVESEWQKLQNFAEKQGLPMTKTISFLIDNAEKMQDVRRAFYDSRVDIALWYCEKLAFSIQALKMNKSKEQLQRVLKLLEQVRKRYRIDISLLHDVVNAFMAENANIVVLNEALKETMKMILRKVMLNE
ncbi:MAG: hypothetical protein DRJ18_01425 [Candidatus Methanomethylicota archaeon]|nr:MAG: hypothetical protein DRJ18_01425 [Candidatus Verstraetearchaeota archaeon]